MRASKVLHHRFPVLLVRDRVLQAVHGLLEGLQEVDGEGTTDHDAVLDADCDPTEYLLGADELPGLGESVGLGEDVGHFAADLVQLDLVVVVGVQGL